MGVSVIPFWKEELVVDMLRGGMLHYTLHGGLYIPSHDIYRSEPLKCGNPCISHYEKSQIHMTLNMGLLLHSFHSNYVHLFMIRMQDHWCKNLQLAYTCTAGI